MTNNLSKLYLMEIFYANSHLRDRACNKCKLALQSSRNSLKLCLFNLQEFMQSTTTTLWRYSGKIKLPKSKLQIWGRGKNISNRSFPTAVNWATVYSGTLLLLLLLKSKARKATSEGQKILHDFSQMNKTKQNLKLPRMPAQRQHIHTACDGQVYIPQEQGEVIWHFQSFPLKFISYTEHESTHIN